MKTIKHLTVALGMSAALVGTALAALPPAPQATQDQAKEAVARSAWQDKVAAYQLCKVQDQVAERYRKDAKGEGKPVPTPVSTTACQEPGPFVSPLAQKPLESSGAHSPAGTASTPPSQNATAAETMGSKKP